MSVLALDDLRVENRVLEAEISAEPALVSDPLRIEYLVEHYLHRVFRNDEYAGDFDSFHYHHLGTGERLACRRLTAPPPTRGSRIRRRPYSHHAGDVTVVRRRTFAR